METKSGSVLGAFTRDFRAEDLLECLSINPGRIGDELVGRGRAIEIWKSLISSRSFTSAVIQADSSIAGRRIVGRRCRSLCLRSAWRCDCDAIHRRRFPNDYP